MTKDDFALYNIAPEGKTRMHSAAEIRTAAQDGMRLYLDIGTRFPRVPVWLASNIDGWITAVGDGGAIYQAWAGCFHGYAK